MYEQVFNLCKAALEKGTKSLDLKQINKKEEVFNYKFDEIFTPIAVHFRGEGVKFVIHATEKISGQSVFFFYQENSSSKLPKPSKDHTIEDLTKKGYFVCAVNIDNYILAQAHKDIDYKANQEAEKAKLKDNIAILASGLSMVLAAPIAFNSSVFDCQEVATVGFTLGVFASSFYSIGHDISYKKIAETALSTSVFYMGTYLLAKSIENNSLMLVVSMAFIGMSAITNHKILCSNSLKDMLTAIPLHFSNLY